MKTVSLAVANDVIGGALNPIAALVKGAQTGYDAGASIMGMLGGLVGGAVGGILGFIGGFVGTVK
ncbi:hypothetical protein AAH446_17725 [Erwinia sp. P6884]|uniref:hypothetical protein n=1 Tax=Erwiniaceae TaxID=1903409 RepID=UPI00318892D8